MNDNEDAYQKGMASGLKLGMQNTLKSVVPILHKYGLSKDQIYNELFAHFNADFSSKELRKIVDTSL